MDSPEDRNKTNFIEMQRYGRYDPGDSENHCSTFKQVVW